MRKKSDVIFVDAMNSIYLVTENAIYILEILFEYNIHILHNNLITEYGEKIASGYDFRYC